MTPAEWFTLAYTVVGGLGIFLFGMKVLSESLQAVASDLIRRIIGWLTSNRIIALLVGLAVTVLVQSSTVTTVMTVGFVNAGLMTLTQAVGVIMGANVGTTITGWVIAFKIGKYGLLLVGLGFFPYFLGRRPIPRNTGKVLIALGMVFLGLEFMAMGLTPLAGSEGFKSVMTYFAADTFPSVLACVVIGCVLTFIVQSSSAMLGITIALGVTGAIGFPTAAALVFGENVGTTITALLASVGGNVHARRAAYAHALFNVLGVCVIVFIFQPWVKLVEAVVEGAPGAVTSLFLLGPAEAVPGSDPLIAVKIAASHSFFNVTNTLFFLPFLPQLVKLVTWMRPERGRKSKQRLKLLGDLSAVSPELALDAAEREVMLMGDLTQEALDKTWAYLLLEQDDQVISGRIAHLETVTDKIQMEITLFLTTVLQMPVTQEQAARSYGLIRISDEIESCADYCRSLMDYKRRILREGYRFSSAAREDLKRLHEKVAWFFIDSMTFVKRRTQADTDDEEVRALVRAADEIQAMTERARDAHLVRVREGACDPVAGLIFSDMLVAYRRIKNHTVNIVDARIGRWEERREALRVLDRVEGGRGAGQAEGKA